MDNSTISDNLKKVAQKMEDARPKNGNPTAELKLVAVSKTQPLNAIEAAIEAGVTHFGENRIEEVAEKWSGLDPALRSRVALHMIGTVQSRKASQVIELCDRVDSVDRVKLALKLNQAVQEKENAAAKLPILLQVNVSGETTKSGFELSPWFEHQDQACLDAFYEAVCQIAELDHLQIQGLMTIAPETSDPESIRYVFRRLKNLQELLQHTFRDQHWDELSMGMSNDYQVAIEEGSTMVRLGRSIFGERK